MKKQERKKAYLRILTLMEKAEIPFICQMIETALNKLNIEGTELYDSQKYLRENNEWEGVFNLEESKTLIALYVALCDNPI